MQPRPCATHRAAEGVAVQQGGGVEHAVGGAGRADEERHLLGVGEREGGEGAPRQSAMFVLSAVPRAVLSAARWLLTLQATPATPRRLLAAPPMVVATCVPCPTKSARRGKRNRAGEGTHQPTRSARRARPLLLPLCCPFSRSPVKLLYSGVPILGLSPLKAALHVGQRLSKAGMQADMRMSPGSGRSLSRQQQQQQTSVCRHSLPHPGLACSSP